MKTFSNIIKLSCLLLLAPVLIWKLALGSTVKLYREKQKLEIQNHTTNYKAESTKSTTLSNTDYEPLLSNGKLLKILADTLHVNQVEVLSYIPEMINSEEGYKLYCSKLSLSGEYIQLVKTISAIEKMKLPLKIASMNFEYDRKKRDAAKKVSLHLLIGQIEH